MRVWGLGYGVCVCVWLGYGVLGLCGWESGAWNGNTGLLDGDRWCLCFVTVL